MTGKSAVWLAATLGIRPLARWIDGAIERFRSGIRHGQVVELHDANHYVFIVEEGLVVREIRKFLLEDSTTAGN